MGYVPYESINVNGGHELKHRHIMESRILHKKLGPDEIVHHINGNTLDNRIENLELMDIKTHTILHVTKLTPDKISQIKKHLRLGYMTQKEIAKQFKVSYSSISNISRKRPKEKLPLGKSGPGWKDVKTTEEMYNT